MLKEGKGLEITLKFKNCVVLDKLTSKFGTGSHVIIPREYVGRDVKIIIGNILKLNKNQITVNFSKSEILERRASKFGTGSHVIIPKEHIGKKIKIIIEGGKK